MTIALTYQPVGATRPADSRWCPRVPGFRWFDIKRRSGFRVTPCAGAVDRVAVDSDYQITAGWGPATVHDPVRIVRVVD